MWCQEMISRNRLLTLFLLFLSSIFWIASVWKWPFFWDLEVYKFAINNYREGKDPYLPRVENFDFLYNPLVLRLLSLVEMTITLELFLLSLYTLWIILVVGILKRVSKGAGSLLFEPTGNLLVFTLFLGYSGFGFMAVFSGNLSLPLHLLIQGMFFKSAQSGKKPGLLLPSIIVISSLIKPYYLFYCLIFAAWGKRYAIKTTLGICGLSFTLWSAGYVLFPNEFKSFVSNLIYGTIESGDTGLNIYSLAQIFFPKSISLTFQIIFSVCLLVYAKKTLEGKAWYPRLAILLVCSVVLNPRLKEYDIASLFFIMPFIVNGKTPQLRESILRNLTILNTILALVVSFWVALDFSPSAKWAVIGGALSLVALILWRVSNLVEPEE